MNVPVELSLAMRYLRPRRTFVSIITLLSFGGVAIAVMVLIVVLSVMTGFRQRLDEKIIGFNAHITVTSDSPIHDADKIVALIDKQPGVLAAEGVVRGPVEVKVTNGGDSRMTVAFITSAPPDGDDPVLPLKKFLIMGQYELRGDSVIVGREWSRRNSVFPGDQVAIYGPAVLHSVEEELESRKSGDAAASNVLVMPDTPVVQGVFETGQYSYDNDFLLVSTAMAQHVYGLGDDVQEIAVRVKDLSQVSAVRDEIDTILPKELVAHTWMDDNRDLFNALATERVVMTFILLMVMIVAGFGLCSTLITITVQKAREIGLMKALGANDSQIYRVFLLHSLIVGVVGAASGTVFGLLVLHYRNPFRDFLLHRFNIQVFSADVYGQAEIPAVINPTVIALIALAAVIICVMAAFFPALSAARLAPARALRYE
jgi:lipoprotein-releasing system permease protein